MNNDEIAKLPELLKPAEAARLLRCTVEQLAKLREARPEVAVQVPGFTHRRYRKSVVLEAAGLRN